MLVMEYKAVVKKPQAKAIDEAIRTSQFVRNKVLRYWIDNRGIGKKELYQYNTQLRAEYEFVRDLSSHACQASVENVERAIKRFYDNCKTKKQGLKGYPRFKKHSRSVEYKQQSWKLHPTKRRITFTDKKGIGELKLLGKWDIHTYPVELIKRVRIVRRADGYYVQFCVKVDNKQEAPLTNSVIGIDVGLEYFYSDSFGKHEENPRYLRKAEKDIKRVQRKIYKKKKGSSGRRKARGVYARKHLKVTRRRNEHAKKLARNLCLANAKVVLEDLNVSGLVRNHKLAKSISDASWYNFRQWLEYFGEKLGREIIAVPPHFTSQECSNCGARVQKSLSTRTHSCLHCGHVEQRDVNAAKVILGRANATGGHPGSNASRDVPSTSVGRKSSKSKERQ
ncbi:transposase [Nostoc commune NIES-4072]|uniref:Transposase n=2 Tax=Nostoc commune TaxID=1178 RepID=A0A2R5FZC1_NOSCO|nr:RNA-guided endonuclease TnpB family protein [Nostoc commune]BBD65139.1 transposase [Nostoc commune HK-02]BBD66602.1 transposase [Nostoc commune HK-02]BBD68012.1 transposase [Nostoc commune HK-02]BBD68951.1 transposase [Nostoc commune HK-02]GBG17536.1 transposase [Nostoc commune NIES-4072]